MSYTSAGDNFQSLIYDPAAYATDLNQSTRPLRYNLDPLYANPCGQTCRPGDIGYISRVGVSIDRNHSLMDTESELKLLNYRASKAPMHKYIPKFLNNGDQQCYTGYPNGGGIQHEIMEQDLCSGPANKFHFPECRGLRTEYTRVTYPTCDLKETGVNRFQPICLDPQHPSRWLQPSEVGINYRMVVKDNHRPCIPTPLDQTAALPKPSRSKALGGDGGVMTSSSGSLPVQEVTLSYLTVPYQEYGHALFCDKGF